jgi:ribosomal protein L7/L12
MNAKVLALVRAMSDAELISTLFLMAEKHPTSFERIMLAKDGKVFNTPQGMLVFSREDVVQLNEYVTASEKIAAIKLVRAVHNLSLKDAKDFVEADYGLKMGSPYRT